MYVISDTQTAFSLFCSRFTKLFDNHFPRKKNKLQYNTRKPWHTPALKQSIRTKNKLYHEFITIGSSCYDCQYKRYRNKLNSLMKCAEKQYFADLLESNKSNLKKTWTIMKHIVNRKKSEITRKNLTFWWHNHKWQSCCWKFQWLFCQHC